MLESALALATGGRPVASGQDLLATARAMVLLGLDAGPRSTASLPRSWPVSRLLVLAAVEELRRDGLVTISVPGPPGTVELTPRGRVSLQGLRQGERRSA